MEHVSAISGAVWGVFTLLLVALAILLVAKRTRLPFTVLLVLVGIGLAWLQGRYPEQLHLLDSLHISPDLILFVFLPTLIFESAYNLDARRLRHNLVPILALAVPGLLLSTGLIGLIVWFATGIPLVAALLLGAILSATDPVAVIALFRQLGAPDSLTTLVEGESLFNDASAIVVSKILVAILLAGTISGDLLSAGVLDFLVLFVGGLLVGMLMGYIASTLIGWVESEPFVEIGLTTALAYLSFLFTEQVLHLSGVMATVGAGLVLGTWGRIRISTSVRIYLEHFWEMLVFMANALLFLLVGMQVDLVALWDAMDVLVWVLGAMLLARAVVIFLMVPMVGRLPGASAINMPYRFVMFWGGLRGAIALAIVLSLPQFEQKELFVALVMGAVLFTLLVQGLSIERLMRKLGLDIPPLADRMSFLEREMVSCERAMERLPTLAKGGAFSSRIIRERMLECDQALRAAAEAIERMRGSEMDDKQEKNRLYLRALIEERTIYSDMYHKGHLSEGSLRELLLVINMQLDALRYQGEFAHIKSHRIKRKLEQAFYRLAKRVTWLQPLAERMHMSRIVRDYEQVWGHYQGSGHVLVMLESLARMESIPVDVVEEVQDKYRHWHQLSAEQLQQVGEQFPEFATSMQERFGKRLVLLTQLETTVEQAERGMLPKGAAETLEEGFSRQLAALRGQPMQRLTDDPVSMLRRVPLFSELDKVLLQELGRLIRPITLSEGEYLFNQGEIAESLYLVSRGVIRFTRLEQGVQHDLGTLIAGECFGEMALMGHGSGDASVVTITPCRLYSLERDRFMAFLKDYPETADALRQHDRELASVRQSKPRE
jgi:Na+:H+ antiporter